MGAGFFLCAEHGAKRHGRVKDKRVLRLIRRYLQAGMCDGGVVSARLEGTPHRVLRHPAPTVEDPGGMPVQAI